jgi:hypothetical protein
LRGDLATDTFKIDDIEAINLPDREAPGGLSFEDFWRK